MAEKKPNPKVDIVATKKSGEPVVEIEAVLVRSQPSIVIKNNGKGDKSYEIKVYADTVEEAVEQAKKTATELDKFIKN